MIKTKKCLLKNLTWLGVGGSANIFKPEIYTCKPTKQIFGPESSGKTTLTLHAIAEAQKLGGTCAFVDAEHALDPVYAKKLGVKTEELLISQPDNGEQALDIH